LLYAPFGGIETGGSMTSFIGGVLAKTIRLDGLGEEIKFPPDGLFRERQIYFDLVK
jgi:hypothetical protein